MKVTNNIINYKKYNPPKNQRKQNNITFSAVNNTNKKNSYNPKIIGMAIALATINPSCTQLSEVERERQATNTMFCPKYETYASLTELAVTEKSMENLIWQLKSALNVDSIKIEHKQNKFKIKGSYQNKNIYMSINPVNNNYKNVYGAILIKDKENKNKQPFIIPYRASLDSEIKDIKVTYRIIKEMPDKKCKIHRNDNGKLFFVYENGDIEEIKK